METDDRICEGCGMPIEHCNALAMSFTDYQRATKRQITPEEDRAMRHGFRVAARYFCAPNPPTDPQG